MWQDERRELGGEWAADEADGRIITWRREGEGERQKKELNQSEEKEGHSESQCNEGIKE